MLYFKLVPEPIAQFMDHLQKINMRFYLCLFERGRRKHGKISHDSGWRYFTRFTEA